MLILYAAGDQVIVEGAEVLMDGGDPGDLVELGRFPTLDRAEVAPPVGRDALPGQGRPEAGEGRRKSGRQGPTGPAIPLIRALMDGPDAMKDRARY